MGDKDEIIRALKLMFSAGDVFEIRVLKAQTGSYNKCHTESGYFDYDHIEQAAAAICAIRAYAGAYVTLNPVDPDLLARAYNRLVPAENRSTTADDDVIRRQWLPIDCDAVRKSNISSTDAEHEAALEMARVIRDGMSSLGWPEPVMLDSGNGAQMLYRIDLPVQDNDLVKQVITSIAAASSDAVNVDLTVYNPARIWRIPGTMNCKGDSIPHRPHRMARIISIPDEMICVSQEQLQEIVPAEMPQEDPEPVIGCSTFNLDEWIAEYCPELGNPIPYHGGRKWIFRVCPFNSDHDNSSAVLIEEPSGAVGFRCHHNGCLGNDWRKLRELREPGCYDREQKTEYPDVDMSKLLPGADKLSIAETAAQTEPANGNLSLFPDPGPFPDELLEIPGFFKEYYDYSIATAHYPNKLLTLGGGLTFLSMLSGRLYQDIRGTHPNIYWISLADSGTGKEHARRVNKNLAMAAGLMGYIGDNIASGEGLEDAMFLSKKKLFMIDEMDTMFNCLKQKDARAEGMMQRLLSFYSAVDSFYTMRAKAKKKGEPADETITNPYLVLYGTALPKYFYGALEERVMENGLIPRTIIVDAGVRGKYGDPHVISPSKELVAMINVFQEKSLEGGNLTSVNPIIRCIEETDQAGQLLREDQEYCDQQSNFFRDHNELAAQVLWARAHEKVRKLAMLYAISENVFNPKITETAVQWSRSLVAYLTKKMLFMADTYSYVDDFDKDCKRVLNVIRTSGGSTTKSNILRSIRRPTDYIRRLLDTLIEREILTETVVPSASGHGRSSRYYTLL